MDEVQKFISENQHQFGYIMQEASKQWYKKDPVGALTVGQCAGTIKKRGAYIQLLDENEQMAEKIDELEKENQYLRDANAINSYTNQMMHGKIERYTIRTKNKGEKKNENQ